MIVPISTGPAPEPPLTIAVDCVGKPSVAVIDQLRAAAKERFASRYGSLSVTEMDAIEEGLRKVLGMK